MDLPDSGGTVQNGALRVDASGDERTRRRTARLAARNGRSGADANNPRISALEPLDEDSCETETEDFQMLSQKPKQRERTRSENFRMQPRETGFRQMMSDYVSSLRPWSFSSSLTPVALGAALAYKSTGVFSIPLFLVTGLTVLAVHAAGNLVNTYYDYVKGFDAEDRTVVDNRLSLDEVVVLGVFSYILGCVGFVILAYMSSARMEHLALVYFLGLSCSFIYTGGVGLKYISLGDITILIVFGPVSLLFSYMAQTGSLDILTVIYAIPLALNTEAILHSNNTRDCESDRKNGAVTLAILIGPTFSYILYALLLFVPYILFVVVSLHYSRWFILPLITLPKAFQLEREFRAGNLQNIPRNTARLNLYFGLFYVIACCLTNPLQLPMIRIR